MKFRSALIVLVPCLFFLPTASATAETQSAPSVKPTVEQLQTRINFLEVALQGAQQQRDAAQKALSDLQLQIYAEKNAPFGGEAKVIQPAK